jgi:hypothetical protein
MRGDPKFEELFQQLLNGDRDWFAIRKNSEACLEYLVTTGEMVKEIIEGEIWYRSLEPAESRVVLTEDYRMMRAIQQLKAEHRNKKIAWQTELINVLQELFGINWGSFDTSAAKGKPSEIVYSRPLSLATAINRLHRSRPFALSSVNGIVQTFNQKTKKPFLLFSSQCMSLIYNVNL